ncbi:hypothetical protein D3C71_1651790 [compost metagenome]
MNSEGTMTATHSGILPWKVPRISSIRNTAAKPNADARRNPSLRPMYGDKKPPKMPNTLNTRAPMVAKMKSLPNRAALIKGKYQPTAKYWIDWPI